MVVSRNGGQSITGSQLSLFSEMTDAELGEKNRKGVGIPPRPVFRSLVNYVASFFAGRTH